MGLPILGPIVSLVNMGFEGILGHFKHKRALKEQKQQSEIDIRKAKVDHTIRRSERQQDADIDWDRIMAENSATSWKDEYWTIVLSIPMILCFIPKLAPYVLYGFKVLEQTPEWYIYSVGVAIAAAFGVRPLINMVNTSLWWKLS